MMADHSSRNRRWFSFSLRAFLSGVLLIAIALSIGTSRWHRYQHQKATIDSLSVEYFRESRLPSWRYLLTSEQLADDVRGIAILGEGDLNSLRMFGRLETLTLLLFDNTDITPLADLTRLKKLHLWESKVNDLTPLAGLTRLTQLHLWGTKVTDLTPLAKLAKVQIYVDTLDQLTVPVELQGRVYSWPDAP